MYIYIGHRIKYQYSINISIFFAIPSLLCTEQLLSKHNYSVFKPILQ